MHKGIIAYIVILIILVIVAIYFSYLPLHSASTTTSVTTVVAKTTTSTTTVVPNATTSSTTTINYGSCLSPDTNVSIPNGNFSTGTFANWTLYGNGFGVLPVNIIFANSHGAFYGQPWSGYNGNFFASTYHGGLTLSPGNLTSAPFKVVEPYLNFKIISPPTKMIYVQILYNGTPMITTYYDTYAGVSNSSPESTFMNASIPLSMLLCKNVQVKVVAQITGDIATSKDYVAVGDFYMSKIPVATPGIIVNQTIS